MTLTSPLIQTGFALAGTLLIYGLSWIVARGILRLVGSESRPWAAGLPWTCLQLYLVVGLLASGALSTGGFGLAAVLMATGAASLGMALVRLRRQPWRARVFLLAWAIPWLGALAYIAL